MLVKPSASVTDYLRRAEEAEAHAAATSNEEAKAEYRRIAQAWSLLAHSADRAASYIAASDNAEFLAATGEMAERTRAADWSKTPLGPIETWPQSLRTAVGIILSSRYAMFVWWGRELTNLYNDAYRPFLGKKHPGALGQSAREVWTEIWDLIGPRTEAVLERAESTFDEALLLVMERFGYPEETYFTFSYSPIRDERGNVGGLFCAVTDETRRIIGERRLRLLGEVAANSSKTHTPEQVCEAAVECITGNPRDLPFALLYLTEGDGQTARLVAQAGMDRGAPGAEPVIDLRASALTWPLREAAATNETVVVEDLMSRFEGLPTGAWDRPPDRAVVVPLAERGDVKVAGFLIAGLNPYLAFEEDYRGFVKLLAGQITAGLASAHAYQEERRRAEALAEIDRAKTAFFSNVSHEFRTPLTLMLGPLEEALAVPPEALPARRADLALVHRSGLRLLRLVNTLLDFSRIEAGRVQASYEPLDLAALTADLASEFRAATEKAGLRLTVDCPPLNEPVWVDRDMWEKIVLNLVSNALKFTFEGGITVRLREREGNAVLTVTDTGGGIPAGELPRIFDRFHRAEGTRGRTHEGTGIGLALVQELARIHGGVVRAESTFGAGSTFTVMVPLGAGHLPADRLRAARVGVSTALGSQPYVEEALRWVAGTDAPNAASDVEPELLTERLSPADGSSERPLILLADDNADMRDYVRRLLAPQYEVNTAADGLAALTAMRQQRPDLLLSDVMMPGLDGFGLVREVRRDPALADIPIVLLSARAGEESTIEGRQAGADDYLVKPFSARELLARVAANLKMSKLRRNFEQRTAADLRAMTLLREVGSQCVRQDVDMKQCLLQIVDAAIAISGADKGNVQLFDPDVSAFTIAAQRGFGGPFLQHFAHVKDFGSAFAAAVQSRARVIVEDVTQSDIFGDAPARQAMIDAGVRAIVSTPLMNSKGNLLGIISTHFATPRRPGERELHFMDLMARQTADYLERKQSGEIEQILVRELQHRSNNLLTVVQAIANGSLGGDQRLPQVRAAFEARLQALARANRQLTNSDWSGIRLGEIVHLELEPYAGRTTIEGADVTLGHQAAQNLSLAMHELATNAAKYGALSTKDGSVRVSWWVENGPRNNALKFKWRESGGPVVAPASRKGFGTSLLSAVCPDIRLDYAPSGLICEFEIPLGIGHAVVDAAADKASRGRAQPKMRSGSSAETT